MKSLHFSDARPSADFKYRFLAIVMASGAGFTFLFEVGSLLGITPLTPAHFFANAVHIVVSLALLAALVRWPARYREIVWAYALDSFAVFVSALLNMPGDEMRFLWFYIQCGGTFLLIGTGAGWSMVAASVAVVLGAQLLGHIGLSDIGTGTFAVGLACAGAMFHAYNRQEAARIADLERVNRALDDAARHDALTGLVNRIAFSELAAPIADLARRTGRPFSILFADIDRFKSINDRFGHAGGDAVLVAVAETLRRAVRASDIVARIGGEEFVLLLAETDATNARTVAEKVRAEVEAARPVVTGAPLAVTVSIGCATWHRGGGPVEAILKEADEAMYRAKQNGRNRVEALQAA